MKFAMSSWNFIPFYSKHFPSADEDGIWLKAPEVLDLFSQTIFMLYATLERQLHCLFKEKLRPLWLHEEMSEKVFCNFSEWSFNTHCLAEGHHQNYKKPLKDCEFNHLLIHVWHTLITPFSFCCLLPPAVGGCCWRNRLLMRLWEP